MSAQFLYTLQHSKDTGETKEHMYTTLESIHTHTPYSSPVPVVLKVSLKTSEFLYKQHNTLVITAPTRLGTRLNH